MPHIIEITDLSAPELAPYTKLTEAQLRNKLEPEKGIFIAESPKVIGTALDAGCEPLSFLMERRQIDGPAAGVLARCPDAAVYTEITYEGYGPGGVAVMVETLTDNRNRTAADLRHYFDKNGGNLGAMGCVGFLFSQKGVIDISLEDKDADEAMMDALDAGAEDFDAGEEAAEITTDPENYSAVVKALEEKGYEILSDDLAMVPMTTTRLTDPDQLKLMGKLLDALEDNDDVQNVWHSLENEEDLPE